MRGPLPPFMPSPQQRQTAGQPVRPVPELRGMVPSIIRTHLSCSCPTVRSCSPLEFAFREE